MVASRTVVFNVRTIGQATYQWYFDGVPLVDGPYVMGATDATLVILNASASNVGTYYCVVTNAFGPTQTADAVLTLSSTNDVGRLVNISCRALVGTGGNILVAGYVVGGDGTSGQEKLLVRGSGPALVPFGVTGTLVDPELTVYNGSTWINQNNGWNGDATIATTASTVGAFTWKDPTSHDSALISSSAPGAYTAQIQGSSGDTGVALAEVFDATPAGSYTLSSPRLINVSARVNVGTGTNILIAGFVIGGSTSETVLIRASGPALNTFGISDTLRDPKLMLYSGSSLLTWNLDWKGSVEISVVGDMVGAFPWRSTKSSDSAILVTLPPGAYTAQVEDESGDTGVALVEVYEVP
jgi:hypothetical protein